MTKGESYTHNKYSKLEIDDFHRVLRHIGFSCLRDQRIEFSKDELLKLIKESRLFCAGLNFNDSDFLKDIINTVPLFAQDGNYYRWAHKSLQEYFAAQYIYLDAKEKQRGILNYLYQSSNIKNFMNVIDLYYDMDYKGFRNVIEHSFLEEYEQHSIGIDAKQIVNIDIEEIVKRKELTFMCEQYVFTLEKDAAPDKLDNSVTHVAGKHSKKRFPGERTSDVYVMSPDNRERYALFYIGLKLSLLEMLGTKKSTIVKFTTKAATMKFRYVPEPLKIVAFTEVPAQGVEPKKHFNRINESLTMGRFGRFVIDHYAAMEKLAEIRESIALEASSDLFNCN